jgi:plasmid maintenance system antidote protein VapI
MIKLDELIQALQMQSDSFTSFLHVKTGIIETILRNGCDTDEEEAEILAQIEDNPEEWLDLPDRFEIDEYQMMVEFAANQSNANHQEQLQAAIHGRSVFQRFRRTTNQLNLTQDWYKFRDQCYLDFAKQWCRDNELTWGQSSS